MSGQYAELATLFGQLRAYDTDYPTRNQLVLSALAEAARLGLPCGLAYDPLGVPGFQIVATIDPPDDDPHLFEQVTWHIREYTGRWDGHDTPTKLDRLAAFAAAYAPRPS